MNRDDIQDIQKYYDSAVEANRVQIHQLEFALTQKIIEQFLVKTSKILELGAGNGFYTEFLAKKGHQVTALELSPVLLESNRANISSKKLGDRVQFILGDAREVLSLTQEKFDMILVMGPLYHLVKHSDRLQLMTDLLERLNPKAKILTSFLTRAGFLSYMIYKYPEWISASLGQAHHLWRKGDILDHPRNGVFRGYFFNLEQIAELHQKAGLQLSSCYAQDPIIGGVDEVFNRLPEPVKKEWVKFLFEISPDANSYGSSRTLMAVSEKKSDEALGPKA